MTDNPFIPDVPDPPEAPPVLFKYVVPERIDVLEGGRIRYTPLLGTNDIFEVRQTFEKLIGPNMHKALLHEAGQIDVDALIAEEVKKAFGIEGEAARALGIAALKSQLGENYQAALGDLLKDTLGKQFIPAANTDQSIATLLEKIGSRLHALSLTDDPYNPAMWAHYGADSRGFVLGFDTGSRLLREAPNGARRPIYKVFYFDGRLPELIDEPNVALFSKTTHWSYEREWRSYIGVEHADQVIQAGETTIHLRNFEPDALRSVIVGGSATQETIDRLRAVIANRYPHASISKLKRKGFSDGFIEEAL